MVAICQNYSQESFLRFFEIFSEQVALEKYNKKKQSQKGKLQ